MYALLETPPGVENGIELTVILTPRRQECIEKNQSQPDWRDMSEI